MKKLYLIICTLNMGLAANAQQYIPFSVQRGTGGAVKEGYSEETEEVTNESYKFSGQIIGIGSANDLTEAKKAGGNLALGTYMTFSKKNVSHALYVIYNARAGNTSDTAVVAKTYLFPDIGKRDFTIGYERIMPVGKNDWTIIPLTAEFSWSSNLLTKGGDSSSKFYSMNFSLGTKFKVTKDFSIGGDLKQLGFSVYPYYQLITIDPKDFKQRNDMLNEKNLPPTFHTIGVCFTLQIAEIGMFFNYKRILNKSADFQDNNLKDGVAVLGVVVGTSIFKFGESSK